MEVKVIFPNGTKLTVEKNGDSLITDKKPDFPGDMSIVIVESDEDNREYHNAEVMECAHVDNRYWFTFTEESEEAIAARKINAKIDYIAMMTDVDLEEV